MKPNRMLYIGIGYLLSTLFFSITACAQQAKVDQKKPKEITFELHKPIEFADGTKKKSIAKAEIQTLRDQSILLWKGIQDEGVELSNRKEEKVHVHTCKEYGDALEQGYFPSSNAAVMDAAWLKYPCGTLNLLEQATPPERSFLPPSEELFDLKLLPLMLFPIMTDFEQAYGYNIENDTYQDRVDKGFMEVKKPQRKPSPFHIAYEDDGMEQRLTQVVRTDFNGDGIEDVLLYEAVYAIGGSHRFFDLIILTRKSVDSKFVIIYKYGSTDIEHP